jgi:cobalt-precorrin-5B (C1)-methyltransferase
MARSGYTLPVFAAAAAKGALLALRGDRPSAIALDLLDGQVAEIALESVARLDDRTALAITRSDPGDNLDLTRHTPIWAWVQVGDWAGEPLRVEGGEGVGQTAEGPAIYRFARSLLNANLQDLLPPDRTTTVRIILPEGRDLAKRTSNEAFGVLEGLSLLGTSGIAQPHTATDKLDESRDRLRQVLATERDVIFCIGSNGQQVADRLGLPAGAIVPVGNWIGAMLVEAALLEVRSVLLLGYHGKLIKLAGGIFNTSSHIADGKLEILAAAALRSGATAEVGRSILACATVAEAVKELARSGWDRRVLQQLAEAIGVRSMAYARKYADRSLAVSVALFERSGRILAVSNQGDRWAIQTE